MTQTPVHVPGTNAHHVMLFALSTCIHCKKTREFLEELGIGYDYLYVDLLPREEMEQVIREMEKHNPRGSFPTLVIDHTTVIIGSRLDEIREALS